MALTGNCKTGFGSRVLKVDITQLGRLWASKAECEGRISVQRYESRE